MSAEQLDLVSSTTASAEPISVRGIASDLVSLTKPRLSSLVLVTTAGGYLLAPGEAAPWRLMLAVGGTGLVVAAAQTLNCWLERDVDGRMHRTRTRPLPAGRLPAGVALAQGIALAFFAVPFLASEINPLTGFLALLALWSYVAVYTPLKRHSSLSTIVGALPGALPPLIGWTAATGKIELPGLVLFGVLFLWQIPHFLALSLFLQEDYARGGLQVLPLERGDAMTRASLALWTIALVPISLLVVPLGLAGATYALGASIAGAIFLALAVWGALKEGGRGWARLVFAWSIVYLTLLFVLLGVDGRG